MSGVGPLYLVQIFFEMVNSPTERSKFGERWGLFVGPGQHLCLVAVTEAVCQLDEGAQTHSHHFVETLQSIRTQI